MLKSAFLFDETENIRRRLDRHNNIRFKLEADYKYGLTDFAADKEGGNAQRYSCFIGVNYVF